MGVSLTEGTQLIYARRRQASLHNCHVHTQPRALVPHFDISPHGTAWTHSCGFNGVLDPAGVTLQLLLNTGTPEPSCCDPFLPHDAQKKARQDVRYVLTCSLRPSTSAYLYLASASSFSFFVRSFSCSAVTHTSALLPSEHTQSCTWLSCQKAHVPDMYEQRNPHLATMTAFCPPGQSHRWSMPAILRKWKTTALCHTAGPPPVGGPQMYNQQGAPL